MTESPGTGPHDTWLAPSGRPQTRRVTIIGCGHVGLIMAAGFARLGHQVIGLDRDAHVVEGLGRGVFRVQEEGLPELVADGLGRGSVALHDLLRGGHP